MDAAMSNHAVNGMPSSIQLHHHTANYVKCITRDPTALNGCVECPSSLRATPYASAENGPAAIYDNGNSKWSSFLSRFHSSGAVGVRCSQGQPSDSSCHLARFTCIFLDYVYIWVCVSQLYLTVYLSFCELTCLSIGLSTSLLISQAACLPLSLSVGLSACLLFSQPAYLSLSLSLVLSACPMVSPPSVILSTCLSVSLSVYTIQS